MSVNRGRRRRRSRAARKRAARRLVEWQAKEAAKLLGPQRSRTYLYDGGNLRVMLDGEELPDVVNVTWEKLQAP